MRPSAVGTVPTTMPPTLTTRSSGVPLPPPSVGRAGSDENEGAVVGGSVGGVDDCVASGLGLGVAVALLPGFVVIGASAVEVPCGGTGVAGEREAGTGDAHETTTTNANGAAWRNDTRCRCRKAHK